MLSLLDPVQIDDLALFRDDEDPRKFYVLPDEPVIPVDAAGVPDFYFIHYIRDLASQPDPPAGGAAPEYAGGYVQFRTVLSMPKEREDKLRNALRAQLTQEKSAGKKPFGVAIDSTEPLLASPLWSKGTVKLETFKVGDNELVRQATDTVPVDLAGALGASVNLTLSSDGAEVFWSSFQHFKEQQIPIVIRYALTYKARVSASMTIHADRSTVVSQIWKKAEPRPARWIGPLRCWQFIPFVGEVSPLLIMKLRQDNGDPTIDALTEWKKVKEAIHSSVTDSTIQVTINVGDGAGGPNDKVQEMLMNLATEVLTSRVIPAIFGDPAPQSSDDTDGGGGPPKGPDDQLVKLPPMDSSDTTTNTFDMSFTSTDVIEQTCNPSAPIHLVLSDPSILNACFKELRLSDGFFAMMRVTAATAGINFAADGISVVHVYLDYDQVDEGSPDRPRVHRAMDQALRSETDTIHWKFDLARDASGGHKRGYRFRTDVIYGDVVVRSGPNDWIDASSEMLDIVPAHMGVLRVQLVLTARRDQVQSARVVLTTTTRAGTTLTDTIELTPDAATKTWLRPTGELAAATGAKPAARTYTYQVTYVVAGNEIAMPPVTASSDGIDLSGPFTKTLHYTLVPQGSFDGVRSISGDATYADPASGYRVTKTYQLESLSASVPFDVPAMDGGPETISVTATVNHADGSSTPLSPLTAPPGQVRIGEVVSSYLEVQVRGDLVDFDKDVQLCVVELSYAGSADGDVATTMTFSKAQSAPQTWKVPLRPGASLDYSAGVRFVAYDRTKSSEQQRTIANTATKTVLLLDRSAR